MKKLALAAAIAAAPFAVMAEDEDAVMTYSALKPDFAVKAAVAAMEACREAGYQVGVSVVDRTGLTQAFVRDRFAGAHTFEALFFERGGGAECEFFAAPGSFGSFNGSFRLVGDVACSAGAQTRSQHAPSGLNFKLAGAIGYVAKTRSHFLLIQF